MMMMTTTSVGWSSLFEFSALWFHLFAIFPLAALSRASAVCASAVSLSISGLDGLGWVLETIIGSYRDDSDDSDDSNDERHQKNASSSRDDKEEEEEEEEWSSRPGVFTDSVQAHVQRRRQVTVAKIRTPPDVQERTQRSRR